MNNTNNCKSQAAQTTAAINMVTTVIQAWDTRLGKMIDTITEAMKTQALTLRESEDRNVIPGSRQSTQGRT